MSAKLGDYSCVPPDSSWAEVSAQISKTATTSSALSISKIAIWIGSAAAVVGIIALSVLSGDSETNEEEEKQWIPQESNSIPLNPKDSLIEETPLEQPQATRADSSRKEVIASATQEIIGNISEVAPEQTAESKTAATEPPAQPEVVLPNTRPMAEASSPVVAEFSAILADPSSLRYFFIPETTDAAYYRWDFGDGEFSNDMSPSHNYSEPGEYIITMMCNKNNKSVEQSKVIVVSPKANIEAPTIFTPNGDGKNDEFDVLANSKYVEIKEVRIYDSRGSLVFLGDAENLWKGNDNGGNRLEEGSYVYVIRGTDLLQVTVEKRGTIYLRR